MNDTVLDNNTSIVEQPEAISKLCKFTDTTSYHQYSPFVYPEFLLTDGVYLLTKNCAGYKLIDFIARQQENPIIHHHKRLQRIQFWSLRVNDAQRNPKGVIRCDWDKDMTVFEETIEVIDFPLEAIEIWVCPYIPTVYEMRGYSKLAMLPSEY